MKSFILAALLTLSAFSASAMTDFEKNILSLWAEYPEQREQTRQLYLEDIQKQVVTLQGMLPVVISETEILFSVEYADGHLTYSYITAAESADEVTRPYDDVQKGMVADRCNDVQIAMYLTLMDGTLEVNYYLRDGKTVFANHVITGEDCHRGNSI